MTRAAIALYVAGMAVGVAYAIHGGAGLAFIATLLMLAGLLAGRKGI